MKRTVGSVIAERRQGLAEGRDEAWIVHLPPACPADLDGGGSVGLTDLVAVLAAWGPCSLCAEDFDVDGGVGLTDLIVLLSAWGACP